MKKIIVILIFMSTYTQAFIIWPGVAPCDTTLQACIDDSPEGEYIEIQTNGPINENIFTNKVVSLVAGNGYNPVFSITNNIQINTLTDASFTLNVKGLILNQGQIMVRQFNGQNTFNISNNQILATSSTKSGIRVDNYSDDELILNMNYNRVNSNINTTPTIPYGAILIWKSDPTDGAISGQIFNNTIVANGIESKGINITDGSNTATNLNVIGNDIAGGTQGGLFIHKPSGNGSLSLNLGSNSFKPEGTFYIPSGIHVINDSGTTDVNIINNTMIKSRWGVFLDENGGTLTAEVHNNLVAYCANGFDFQPSVTVNNDYNLNYQNSFDNNYSPGAHSVNENPLIKATTNPRIQKGSPAQDTGNPLALFLLPGDTPFVDVDGSNRLKKDGIGSSVIDIGAYEHGDLYFNHINSGEGSHVSIINNANTDGLSTLDNLHLTSNWNPYPNSPGIYNVDNEGLFYQSGTWRIFNEGFSDINTGATFNIVKYGSSSNTFEHNVSTGGSNSSTINHAGLDGNSDKILQVSQHWIGDYNPHPPGILYSSGNWRILNFDLANIPQDSNFNIYYQDQSKSAWEHRASAANISFNYTYLNNPIINNVDCAQIQVTQSASQGVFNGKAIGVWYDNSSSKWAIYNQDQSAMPNDAAFHVIVSPEQIAECTDVIFKNGLE